MAFAVAGSPVVRATVGMVIVSQIPNANLFQHINTKKKISKIFLGVKMSISNNYNFMKNGKKILGAALNYLSIVKARNVPVPKTPILFLKPTSSYIKEDEDIIIPKMFKKVAEEVELGVVIGKKCKNVSSADAMSFVQGYCLALDLTAQCELAFVREKGQPWCMGKGFDTACPVSRFIQLSEIKDPHNIELRCYINRKLVQEGNTSDMIFKIPTLIEHASKYMTLEPNDVILTGTPDGATPIIPGDIVECTLGDLVNIRFKVKSE